MAGKGCARRPCDEKAYAENWERIFKKNEEVNEYVKVAIKRINKDKNDKKDRRSC